MGDSRRFHLFAELIARNFRSDLAVADVAGGSGKLQAKLRRRGFANVESWDKRPKYAARPSFYRYALFDYRHAPRGYGLVVGMHPDGGTDHIVAYAVKHRVPFCVCPCCVLPSATRFEGVGYSGWVDHLCRVAERGRMHVTVTALPMYGRSTVIIGRPE